MSRSTEDMRCHDLGLGEEADNSGGRLDRRNTRTTGRAARCTAWNPCCCREYLKLCTHANCTAYGQYKTEENWVRPPRTESPWAPGSYACTPGFGEPSARLASQRFGSHVFGSQGQVHVALGSQVSCRSPDARSTFSAPGFNALLVRLEVGLIFQQSLVQSLECKFTTAGFHNYSCVIMMKIFRCSPWSFWWCKDFWDMFTHCIFFFRNTYSMLAIFKLTSKICPCVATGEKYQIDVTYLFIFIFFIKFKVYNLFY